MKKLDRITNRFDIAYTRSKKYQDTLKERQQEMFKVFSDQFDQRRLASKTVTVPFEVTGKEILQRHPGWRIVDSHTMGENHVYLIEEDP